MTDIEVIENAAIPMLGEPRVDNPDKEAAFTDCNMRMPLDPMFTMVDGKPVPKEQSTFFEVAGPRKKIYFDPSKARAAIVTCGGLCPGINSVIQSIVMTLHYRYGVRKICGFQYGLQGFIPEYGHDLVELTPDTVRFIHRFGGTILGSSRGPQPNDVIVDCLAQHDIQMLFLIGGNGTMRAAEAIQKEVDRQGLKKSIIGIPKTIDNDIFLVTRSFGFETAVGHATDAARSAHVEAEGAYNGVGLVKLMGRDAGFIGAYATLASKDVNFLLIPEQEFDLEGPNGLFAKLVERVKKRKHALVVVSEGAGQHFFETEGNAKDASGNVKNSDIGLFLKEKITAHFKELDIPLTLKYIDPSYIIRSVPASADDNIFCNFLGQNAVHAAMSGRTGMVVAERRGHLVNMPLHAVNSGTRNIKLDSALWQSILETTGQPRNMLNE